MHLKKHSNKPQNKRFKIKNSDDIERIKRENNKDKSVYNYND